MLRDEACSEQLFKEVTERYSFVAGSQAEYEAYFKRGDLPRGQWSYALSHEVQATSRCAVVRNIGKCDGVIRQRKLLICCTANLVLREARGMDESGLHGGGGLAQTFAPEEGLCASLFDEPNASCRLG